MKGAFDQLLAQEMAKPQQGAFPIPAPVLRGPGRVKGPGHGRSDSVPAVGPGGTAHALSDGEYIIPADVVSAFGQGSSEAGANVLDGMVMQARGAFAEHLRDIPPPRGSDMGAFGEPAQGGGAFDGYFLGGLFDSGSEESSVTVEVDPFADQLRRESRQFALEDNADYDAKRVVTDFTGDQLGAFNIARGAAGGARGAFDQSYDLADRGSQAVTSDRVVNEMNPYTDKVAEALNRKWAMDRGMRERSLGLRSGAFGATGGDAHSRMEGIDNYLANVKEDQALTNLYMGAFDTTYNQLAGQRDQDYRGASVQSDLGQRGMGNLMTVGDAQQARADARGAFDFEQNFLPDRADQKHGRLLGTMGASQYGSTTTQRTPTASVGQQILGGLAGGVGMAAKLGWNPFGAASSAASNTLSKNGGRIGYANGGAFDDLLEYDTESTGVAPGGAFAEFVPSYDLDAKPDTTGAFSVAPAPKAKPLAGAFPMPSSVPEVTEEKPAMGAFGDVVKPEPTGGAFDDRGPMWATPLMNAGFALMAGPANFGKALAQAGSTFAQGYDAERTARANAEKKAKLQSLAQKALEGDKAAFAMLASQDPEMAKMVAEVENQKAERGLTKAKTGKTMAETDQIARAPEEAEKARNAELQEMMVKFGLEGEQKAEDRAHDMKMLSAKFGNDARLAQLKGAIAAAKPSDMQRMMADAGIDPASEEGRALMRQALQTKVEGTPLVEFRGESALSKVHAKTLEDRLAATEKIQGVLPDLDRLEMALEKYDQTGAAGETRLMLNQFGQALGLPVENLDEGEVIQSIQARLAPAMRVAGSGASSDRDVQLFMQSLPNLSRTKAGNLKVIDHIRRIAERNRQINTIYENSMLESNRITPEARQAVEDLGPIYSEEERRELTGMGEPEQQTSKPASVARPASQADYDALPSGARFIAPDGSTRVKP